MFKIFGYKSETTPTTETDQSNKKINDDLICSLNKTLHEQNILLRDKDTKISELQKTVDSLKNNISQTVKSQVDEILKEDKNYVQRLERELIIAEKSIEHYKNLVDDLISKKI